VVFLHFVIVAVDFVERPLDICYFSCNGVQSRVCPAGKLAHGFCGVDVLGTRGLVDRKRIIAHRIGFRVDVWDFGFAGTASVAEDYGAILVEALVLVDGQVSFCVPPSRNLFIALKNRGIEMQ
jgi:hypothetical protein